MKIHCGDRLVEARAYAKETGDDSLEKCLKSMELYEKNYNGEVHLYQDFAPLSMLFDVVCNGVRVLNGGIIYHGNPDVSYSVQLVPSVGWQIHT